MWAIALLVFACCFGVTYLLLGRILRHRLAVAERLAYYTNPRRATASAPGRWSDLPTADRLMNRLNLTRSLEHLLDQADLPMKPFEFALIVAVCALGLSLVGLFVRLNPALAAGMGLIGFLAPVMWVRFRRQARLQAFDRQLPDALQAISSTLRAGYGFSQGMAVVAKDLPAPVSVEFARAQREMNLGLTVEEVLQNMSGRMRSLDFDLAVSGILINRQVGGNLSELLDQITATVRERVKLKNFIRVLTAEQRLSAVIIMAVPPLLLVILMTFWREYTSYLLFTRVGHLMLAVSLFMQLVGVYFIRRIIAIEV